MRALVNLFSHQFLCVCMCVHREKCLNVPSLYDSDTMRDFDLHSLNEASLTPSLPGSIIIKKLLHSYRTYPQFDLHLKTVPRF